MLVISRQLIEVPHCCNLFGPVVLRTNRYGEDLPALLGCAEEGLDEFLTLGGLQNGIPMY